VLNADRITADPYEMLAHYALGDMPGYTGGEGSPVRWLRDAHRGVHLLRAIDVPKGQRRYVFSPRFEFRLDTAFAEVVRGCADRPRTGGHTWILPPLAEAYCKLHAMGFAHSYETWQDGQLVGGCFGVHIGAYASIESLFHRVSHASKAAYGRALVHLKERGFTLIDSNPVKDVSRNYGEEWIPRWKFESLLRHAIETPTDFTADRPAPPLPARVRRLLPVARVVRTVAAKLTGSP
jgi:leucyl/phenylalanyl-tRNA--protein transferase